MDKINELLNIILGVFGFEPLPLASIQSIFMDGVLSNWWQLLNPNLFVPLLFYLSFGWGMLYILFILPFRFLKNWLRVPDRKGKR